MPGLPTGTVTFLFTDIEGATRLLKHLGDRYVDVLTEYRRLLRSTVQERGGQEVDTQGDAFFCAFPRAADAVAAAIRAQRAILRHPWPQSAQVYARMGLHTGEALPTDTGYVGLDVHRAARICAAGHGGQILLSQSTHDLVADDPPEGVSFRDLGEHRLKDLTRPQRVFQTVGQDLPADFPPLRSLDVRLNNLPVQLTSFIGREREIAEVRRLLVGTRLLTIVGAGGVGKTRLAFHVGADVLEEYSDGVWVSELAALVDPALLAHTVASALRVREQPGRPILATLSDYLQPKHLLLILDNCEHLVAACAELADALLRSCPSLGILVTSRERLGIAGETTWRAPSLSSPELQFVAVEDARAYGAVRLFAERASAANPAFALTRESAPVVAQVCRQLDGIPLAIELAAARVNVFPVEQIATRLDLRLLTRGSRTALPRHQTLRSTLDWSHGLLSRAEQTLFHRLSVFAGGFTLEAAEAVCAGGDIGEVDVAELLSQLVEKSLVVPEEQHGKGRYRLLEPVRQYAQEKLVEVGEAERVSLRHLEFFCTLAESIEDVGPHMAFDTWLERMQEDQGNLRAALEWALGGDHAEAGLRLATALWRFWFHRGRLGEGRDIVTRALAIAKDAPAPVRARALNGAGFFSLWQDRMEEAIALCEESLSLSHTVGDTQTIALSLAIQGHALWHLGKQARGEELVDRAASLARQTGHKQTLLAALRELSYTAWHMGEFERRAGVFEEYLALSRELGNKSAMADSLRFVGEVALNRKHYTQAVKLYEESLALSRTLNDTVATAQAQISLANTLEAQGQFSQARAFYEESLLLLRQVQQKWWLARCLEGLARVEGERFGPLRGTRLLGAAEVLREASGGAPPPLDQALNARAAAVSRRALGDEAFAAAWAEGRAMTLEQAVERALAATSDAPVKGSAQPPGSSDLNLLTPREREVVGLIARGLSNREIAETLVITERTAESHVQHILDKLEFRSRSQIAAWAVERGLHRPSQG